MRTIKSFILSFLLIASVTLFNSCNDDDDNGGSAEDSIVGAFLSTSRVTEIFRNDALEETQEEIFDENNFIRVTFNADNTFSSFTSEEFGGEIDTFTITGTYFVNEGVISITEDNDEDTDDDTDFDFILNGGVLTLILEDTEEFNGDVFRAVSTLVLERQ